MELLAVTDPRGWTVCSPEGEHSSTRGTIRSQLGSWADAERRDGGPKQLIPALTLTLPVCVKHTHTHRGETP